MKNKLIAVVGLPGSGKSEAVRYLETKNFSKVYFGDLTFEEIKRRGLPVTADNEQMIREDLRKQYGMAAYATLNIEKIRDKYTRGNVVVESMYSWQEYLVLRQEFGDNFHVIAIYASPATRYSRITKRQENKADQTRTFTLEEAKTRDRTQIENIAIAGPIAMADFTINNEGDVNELHQQIDKVLEKLN